MADNYAGQGTSGLRPGGQMDQDIKAMSDPAKRAAKVEATRKAAMEAQTAQNLKAATGGGGEITSLNEILADKELARMRPDFQPGMDPKKYMTNLGKRIDGLMKQADEAGSNVMAANTFRRVAGILQQRLKLMQDEQAARAVQEAVDGKAASQPTGGK